MARVVLSGGQLELMVLKAFPNHSDSMIHGVCFVFDTVLMQPTRGSRSGQRSAGIRMQKQPQDSRLDSTFLEASSRETVLRLPLPEACRSPALGWLLAEQLLIPLPAWLGTPWLHALAPKPFRMKRNPSRPSQSCLFCERRRAAPRTELACWALPFRGAGNEREYSCL